MSAPWGKQSRCYKFFHVILSTRENTFTLFTYLHQTHFIIINKSLYWHILSQTFSYSAPHPSPREYWMIYRGTGFLAVAWFGSSPTLSPQSPISKLFLILSLPVSLLTGEGGWVGEEPNHSIQFTHLRNQCTSCEQLDWQIKRGM